MQRGRSKHIILATVIAVSFLFTATAWAQSFRGSIRGQVTAPSGSVIVGAKVTAKNIGTGLQRRRRSGLRIKASRRLISH